MPLNFPNNPVENQEYSYKGYRYVYSRGRWVNHGLTFPTGVDGLVDVQGTQTTDDVVIWDGTSVWNINQNVYSETSSHAFKMSKVSNGNQTCSNVTYTKWNFDTVDYDVSGITDLTNNQVTIPQSGMWMFTVSAYISNTHDWDAMHMTRILINESTSPYRRGMWGRMHHQFSPMPTNIVLAATQILPFDTGTTLGIDTYVWSGSRTLYAHANRTYFSGYFLGY